MGYRWKPSKSARLEFAREMERINEFCHQNGIHASASNDSYYFSINGQDYRVSNHTVESSNRGAFAENWNGETVQVRDLYHASGRDDSTIYIHAGKTRIIDIYTALVAGKKLDGRGYEV